MKAFSLTPTISHTSLVDWWFEHYTSFSSHLITSTRSVAECLDTYKPTNEVTSGFEFHHYDSNKSADYLVYLSSSELSRVRGVSFPYWWTEYLASLESTQSNQSFSLIPENWLEFDFLGDNLHLVGLWQCIQEKTKLYSYDSWRNLALVLSSNFISFDALVLSSLMPSVVRHFSIPSQLGLMHGRSSKLKIMYELFCPNSIESFISFIQTCSEDVRQLFSPIASFFSVHGSLLRPAISLDIDLNSDVLKPENIAIEIHPLGQLGRQLLPVTDSFLSNTLAVSPDQLQNLDSLLIQLPFGQSHSFPFSNTQSRIENRARLNHLKVQYRDGGWQLKSYVKLIQSFVVDPKLDV